MDWFEGAEGLLLRSRPWDTEWCIGMTHSEPEQVTPGLIDELHRITPYDPDHLPREIELIEALRQRLIRTAPGGLF